MRLASHQRSSLAFFALSKWRRKRRIRPFAASVFGRSSLPRNGFHERRHLTGIHQHIGPKAFTRDSKIAHLFVFWARRAGYTSIRVAGRFAHGCRGTDAGACRSLNPGRREYALMPRRGQEAPLRSNVYEQFAHRESQKISPSSQPGARITGADLTAPFLITPGRTHAAQDPGRAA